MDRSQVEYLPKRAGWCNWQVVWTDPADGIERRAVWGVRFWRWITAARVAQDMTVQARTAFWCGTHFEPEAGGGR